MNDVTLKQRGYTGTEVLALAFGAMIGWGWVVLSGTWIENAGTMGSLLAFVVGGVLVIFIGMIYGELTSMNPQNGGTAHFVDQAFGATWSKVTSWTLALAYVSVIAFEAIAFSSVLTHLFGTGIQWGYLYTLGGTEVFLSEILISMLGTLLILWVNGKGETVIGKFQTFVTILILIAGVALVFANTQVPLNSEAIIEVKSGFKGFMAVFIMTPFMFMGFDVIPQISGSSNVPLKKMGAMVSVSVTLAALWYMAIIFSVGNILASDHLTQGIAAADALAYAFNNNLILGKIMILAGIGGIISSWNAFMTGGTAVISPLLQRDSISKKKASKNALTILGLVSLLSPCLGKAYMTSFINAGSFAMILVYGVVVLSYVVIKRKAPEIYRPYKVPMWPIVVICSTLTIIGTAIASMPGSPVALTAFEWLIISIWMVCGYFVLKPVMKNRSSLETRIVN